MASAHLKWLRSSLKSNGPRRAPPGVTLDERRDLRARQVLGTPHERRRRVQQLGRVGLAVGVACRRAAPCSKQEVVGEVVADHRAVHVLRAARSPTSRRRRPALALGEDVPERLDAAHPARHRKLLAGLVVDRHEVADAVLVGRLAGGDRRQDRGVAAGHEQCDEVADAVLSPGSGRRSPPARRPTSTASATSPRSTTRPASSCR